MKLGEMVGKTKGEEEKEPEGIAVVGPSWEAIVYSSGNTPLFCFLTNHFMNCFILHLTASYSSMIGWICILNHASPSYLGPSCSQMSLMNRVKQWQRLRRSRSWGWGKIEWRWGLPALPEEEAQGLLCEVFPSFYL